jgi:hypothetical protein
MNLVTPKAGAKHDILFNEPASNLACKYSTRLEWTDSDKHSSLLRCGINNAYKKFYRINQVFVTMKKKFKRMETWKVLKASR